MSVTPMSTGKNGWNDTDQSERQRPRKKALVCKFTTRQYRNMRQKMAEKSPTKPQANPSPATSAKSPSEKPIQEMSLKEIADRAQAMMIENLKNPENHSAYHECDVTPATSELSPSEKPVQEETMQEIGDRIGRMMLENLRDPDCHPTPIRHPDENGKSSTKTIDKE